MVSLLYLVAMIGAVVVFALATANLPARPNLLALGLLLLTVGLVLAAWGGAAPLPALR